MAQRNNRRETPGVDHIPDDIGKKHELYRLFTLNLELAKSTLGPFIANLFRLKVEGAEHVPADEPCIVVSNHASYLDPIVIGLYHPRPVTFLAMSDLFTIKEQLNDLFNQIGTITGMPFMWSLSRPFFEMFSSVVGDGFKTQLLEWQAVPIVRNYRPSSAKEAAAYYQQVQAQMRALLEEGRSVGIFPEGGRTRTGDILEFKGMAATLAIDSNRPIVPAALVGTFGALEAGNLLTGKTFTRDIRYVIGKPIYPDEFPAGKNKKLRIKELSALMRARVMELAGVRESDQAAPQSAKAPEPQPKTEEAQTPVTEPEPEPVGKKKRGPRKNAAKKAAKKTGRKSSRKRYQSDAAPSTPIPKTEPSGGDESLEEPYLFKQEG